MAINRRKRQQRLNGLNKPVHKSLKVNFAQDLSDHATELLWGQGFHAIHNNDRANKRLQELVKYNKFSLQFPYLEKQLSLIGNMYSTIDMVDGKPTWTLCDPSLNSNLNGEVPEGRVPNTGLTMYGMGKALVTDEVAVIWKRITYGTVSFPIKEIWDKEKVRRIFFGENGKRVNIGAVNKELPEEQQLSELWEHNLGFVPVIWHKNLPTFNSLSFSDGYKGKDIQEMANQTLSQLWYELGTNRTRLFGSMSEEKFAELVKSGAVNELVMQDMLINVPSRNSQGEEANALVPIMGDPKLDVYWKAYNSAKDEYFKLAGYSPLGDGNTEKTATENLLMKTGDYQTTKKKRNLRYEEIYSLFEMIMKIDAKWGFGDIYGDIEEDFSFEIMENKVMDSLNEITNINMMVENRYMSRVEAISQLRGISKDEAQAVLDEINKEALKDAEIAQAFDGIYGEEEKGAENEDKSKENK